MKKAVTLLIAVGAVVSLSAASFATVIHVPADQPTIQAGIDAATPGDTVLVADGTYTGNGNRDINFGGKGIVLKSENGSDSTIIDCQGNSLDPHRGFAFLSGEDSTAVVDGFTIQGGYGPFDGWQGTSVGGGLKCSTSSPSLINNTISGNSAAWGGGISCTYNSNPTISNNTISGNLAYGSVGGGGGIYCSYSNPTISNNTISANSADEYGGGITCYYSNPTISNNTISGNSSDGVGGGIECYNSSPTISNTIIAFSSQGEAIYCDLFSDPILTCCDVYGNEGGDWVGCIAGQAGINGNFSADPLFCDTSLGWLNIDSLSPCAPYNNDCDTLIGSMDVGCICIDSDGDGYGDPGHPENNCPDDNCPTVYNPAQEDTDADGIGDSCDVCTDTDGDGYGDGLPYDTCALDNCPDTANADQSDVDGDGIGDSCDVCTDTDGDGFGDPGFPANICTVDNCPDTANPDQADTDGDGVGDACCCTARGNADGDGGVNVADLTYLVEYLFFEGPTPPCPEEGNADGIGGINVADLTYLVDYLFFQGPAPPPCP